jgi:hypothetical protein
MRLTPRARVGEDPNPPAMPGSGVPGDTVNEWEARPRDYLHLTQPAR